MLIIKSVFDNVVDDVDDVRHWLQCLRNGAQGELSDLAVEPSASNTANEETNVTIDEVYESSESGEWETLDTPMCGDGWVTEPAFMTSRLCLPWGLLLKVSVVWNSRMYLNAPTV